MTTSATSLTAIAHLVALGWTIGPGPQHAATKEFASAVGPKEAALYCRRRHTGEHDLTGTFWSEGRNALSATVATLPAGADDAAIAAAVDKYVRDVESVIYDAYAVRLLNRRAA